MTGRIVILGGYGAVGREAAGALSRWYPGEIVVAGRDPGKARPVTGAVPLRLDVRDQAAVERAVTGAHAVLMCAERDNARVARSCLDRGVHYLDVSASHRLLARIERLNGHARSRSVTALLSVHLAPGVTNLLARHCVTAPGDAEEVRIGVLLGGGERHGPAAIRWTLDGLGEPGTSWRMRFPEPYGVRAVHAFPFSDQHTLPASLGVTKVTTGLCLDSEVLTRLLAAAPRLGVTRLAARPRVRAALVAALGRVRVGGDGFAVTVSAGTGSAGTVTASFSGRRQSRATGLVAALLVRRLGSLPAGVHHIEEVVEPAEFLGELAAEGFDVVLGAPHYDAG